MVRINEIISRELEMDGQEISTSTRFDISAINFDLLTKEFQRAKNKALIFKDLQSILEDQLDKMCSANPNRIDFYERFQKIIEEYNKDQDRAEIEKIFQELIDLASELTEEESRVVKILSRDDLHINTLVVEANIPVNRMSAILFELEMKGVVKALVGGVYHLLA